MKRYILTSIFAFLAIGVSTAQIDRSKRPTPKPMPQVQLAKPQSFDLKNGLEVIVVTNRKLPRVRMQLLIDNPLHASGEKAGVESLLSAMLGNGTTSIPKDDFNEEVDFMGASISFGSQSGFAQGLSKYTDRIFELFADAAANPLLTEGEFEKEKDKLLEGLRTEEKDVKAISGRVSTALLYGKNHPKGEFTTREKVEKLTLRDVQEYYDNFFHPQHAYLVVLGDVSFREVKRLAKKHFKDWRRKNTTRIDYSDPADVSGTQVNFVDMPNAVQSEIVIENVVDLPMDHPDYHAVLLANYILGGGGTHTMLNASLRETHGYTYGSYSNTGSGKHVSRFIASASVRNEVTDSAVVEAVKVIRNIRDELVTTTQLANAKAKFTGDFVMNLEKPETLANYALRTRTQNLPGNFYKNYLQKINAVTREDIQRVARRYYKADNFRIVVTGKGSEILEGLQNMKNPDGSPVPVRYFDKYAEETEAPVYEIELDPSITVESVFDSYLEAIGGREVAESVETLYILSGGEVQGMQMQVEQKATASGKEYFAMKMGGMEVNKSVFDGEKGYASGMGQRQDFTEEQVEARKKAAGIFPELNAKNAELLRIEKVDGKDAYVVSIGDDTSLHFYDRESGLKLRSDTTEEAQGQQMTTSVYYSDYREVQGVKLPFAVAISVMGQEMSFEVTEAKLNEGVSDSDFE